MTLKLHDHPFGRGYDATQKAVVKMTVAIDVYRDEYLKELEAWFCSEKNINVNEMEFTIRSIPVFKLKRQSHSWRVMRVENTVDYWGHRKWLNCPGKSLATILQGEKEAVVYEDKKYGMFQGPTSFIRFVTPISVGAQLHKHWIGGKLRNGNNPASGSCVFIDSFGHVSG